MAAMTSTEQSLVLIWARVVEAGKDWYYLFDRLREIACVLDINGCHDGAALFNDASDIALWRHIDGIRRAA